MTVPKAQASQYSRQELSVEKKKGAPGKSGEKKGGNDRDLPKAFYPPTENHPTFFALPEEELARMHTSPLIPDSKPVSSCSQA